MLFAFQGGTKDGDVTDHPAPTGLEAGFRLRFNCTDPTCVDAPGCPDEWYQVSDRVLSTAAGPATVVVYLGAYELPPESALD